MDWCSWGYRRTRVIGLLVISFSRVVDGVSGAFSEVIEYILTHNEPRKPKKIMISVTRR